MKCKYPKWAIDKVFKNKKVQEWKTEETITEEPNREVSHSSAILRGPMSCSKYGVQEHFKGGNTLTKSPDVPTRQRCNNQRYIISWFKCGKTECDDEYMGESGRTFEEHYEEHFKAPSPIFEHQNTTGHIATVDNFKMIGKEGHNVARTIKEVIYIRVNNPTLNTNVGK